MGEYAHNQREALARFLDDGRLVLDNNEIERELRAVALGRKNWMAAGSEVGGETAAIGFTMVSSALACGVDPVEWLEDVLERIVTCPPERLPDLLPDRWKTMRPTQPTAASRPAAVSNDTVPEPVARENESADPASDPAVPMESTPSESTQQTRNHQPDVTAPNESPRPSAAALENADRVTPVPAEPAPDTSPDRERPRHPGRSRHGTRAPPR